MVSHSQRDDLIYKGYLFWTCCQIKDETLAFCPDTTMILILLGKEVSELLEDDLNFVSGSVFYMNYAIMQKPAKFLVPSSLYSKTFLILIRGHSRLWCGGTFTSWVIHWFKNNRLISKVDNSAKMKICKINVNSPTVYICKIFHKSPFSRW